MNEILDKKEYRVLARKYRPQKFLELVGQDILVKTLNNAIVKNRIAHAYLLTGVRGVGKTTTARIIAMSLNCEKKSKDSSEPCVQCETCLSIKEDRSMDVIEMDAASKTGVDDIREIIDNIKYKPVNNKYKIFIIDEVHMLSKNAFNALLKTLEEPPSHVKFIFATTEVKKIPITIISRCQRFDLQRIDTEILTKHLIEISEKEKVSIDKDAIALIVRASEGSVRDALSLLDQAMVNEKEKIDSQSIILMLGMADRMSIFELLDNIFRGDSEKSLEKYKDIYNSGADILMIFDEMLKVIHFLTKMKILPNIKEDLHIPDQERKKGFEMSEKISISSLGILWQVLFKGYQELQNGLNLFQHGEMLIIRMIFIHDGPSPDDLINKIEKNLEKKDYQSEKSEILELDKKPPIVNKVSTENPKKENEFSNQVQIKSFREFVNLFYKKKEGMLHTYLYNDVKLISFKEGEIVFNDKKVTNLHFSRTVAKFISKWTGRIWQISSSSSNIGKTLYEEDLMEQQKNIDLMKNDPEIKKILDKFPGSKIFSITDIEETSEIEDLNNTINNLKEN